MEFFSVLNEHHPSIKLKYNLQKERVEFLDTVVFFMPSFDGLTKNLATKVYFKPTDRHALLHRKSYHPQHTFRGLIKSQLIRFHRICTYPDDVEEATLTLFQALATRGYSRRFLRKIKAEGAKIFNDQNEYKREGQGPPLVPMVFTPPL